jgi:hypothetical protein
MNINSTNGNHNEEQLVLYNITSVPVLELPLEQPTYQVMALDVHGRQPLLQYSYDLMQLLLAN